MNSATISLVDARTLDAVVALFEAQLREHAITSCSEDLRLVTETVMRDGRYGFMLVAIAPDGCSVGVA